MFIEHDLVESSNGQVTVDLNMFAFKALRDSTLLVDQARYEKYATLRRFGGTLSLGGKGERFDRDGDGEVDDALEAEELNDIVTWEFRLRLFGSRDRRDPKNYHGFFSAVANYREDKVLDEVTLTIGLKEILAGAQDYKDERGCFDVESLKNYLSDYKKKNEDKIKSAQETMTDAEEKIRGYSKGIDRAPILTLVLGGVERGDEFGPNKEMAALRFAWGDFQANLEHSRSDGLMGAADPETWKLSAKYSALVWRELAGDGAELSLEGSYETFDNVPDAKHDTNSTVGLKLSIPLTEAISIPASVVWANHVDLLSDEDTIRGHVGFSLDLGKLLKTKQGS
jgi:hypothetical protein